MFRREIKGPGKRNRDMRTHRQRRPRQPIRERMTSSPGAAPQMLGEPTRTVIRVEDRQGVVHELEPVEGWRLMEILRDYGIGMDNTCGGALACAECHVVLDADSAALVPPPRD